MDIGLVMMIFAAGIIFIPADQTEQWFYVIVILDALYVVLYAIINEVKDYFNA